MKLGVLTPEVKRRRAAKLDAGNAAPSPPLRAVPDPGPPCTHCGASNPCRKPIALRHGVDERDAGA
jgi:hypothetical protein